MGVGTREMLLKEGQKNAEQIRELKDCITSTGEEQAKRLDRREYYRAQAAEEDHLSLLAAVKHTLQTKLTDICDADKDAEQQWRGEWRGELRNMGHTLQEAISAAVSTCTQAVTDRAQDSFSKSLKEWTTDRRDWSPTWAFDAQEIKKRMESVEGWITSTENAGMNWSHESGRAELDEMKTAIAEVRGVARQLSQQVQEFTMAAR